MAKATVRYKGLSDVREMTKKQLAEAGVTVEHDLVWERRNLFKQEVELTEELEQVLRDEGTFRIEKHKDDGESETIVDNSKADDTVGATAVDGNTGQVSKPKDK